MSPNAQESSTKASLIQAGLHLFGHKGFDGTSTRELAAHAGTNIASITYHFGGKSGLRLACARDVVARMNGLLDVSGGTRRPGSPQDALDQIERLLGGFVRFVVGAEEAVDFVPFMLRELTDPGEISDVIYAELLEPRHKAFCDLWATATGRGADDDEVKLAVFSIMGNILYFRIARPFVVRRMAWDRIGDMETNTIAETVLGNLRQTIERQRI